MSITFKDEPWTLAQQPTHKVIAQHGRIMTIVGYFIAEEPSEVSIVMECFKDEYGNQYDRLMAVETVSGVVRTIPSNQERVSFTNLLNMRKSA